MGKFKSINDLMNQFVFAQQNEDYQVKNDDFFIYAKPNILIMPEQGWKIHVSAFFDNYLDIAFKTINYCFENKLAFKIIINETIFNHSISKNAQRASSGKFITIYFENESSFIETIKNLDEILKHDHGPSILSDYAYYDSKVLYYRYGSYIYQGLIKHPDGYDIEDKVLPYYQQPDFVTNPFEQKNKPLMYLNNRYQVFKVLHYSNGGGIYVAEDIITKTNVILKEARPYIGENIVNTAIFFRENEKQHLINQELAQFVPSYIDLFYSYNHLFLVVDLIEGETLYEWMSKHTIAIKHKEDKKNSYFISKIKNIMIQLIKLMQTFHEQDLVIQDISLSNFILTPDEHIKLIDLETVRHVNDRRHCYRLDASELSRDNYENLSLKDKDCQRLGYMLLSLFSSSYRLLSIDRSGERTMLLFKNLMAYYQLPQVYIDVIEALINKPRISLKDILSWLLLDRKDNTPCIAQTKKINEKIILQMDLHFKDMTIYELFNLDQGVTLTYLIHKGTISFDKQRIETVFNEKLSQQKEDDKKLLIMVLMHYLKLTIMSHVNVNVDNGNRISEQLYMHLLLVDPIISDSNLVKNLIDNQIKLLYEVDGYYYLKTDDGNYNPYLAGGTAGLILVLMNYQKRFKDNRYEKLIHQLILTTQIVSSKTGGLADGLGGLLYINKEYTKMFSVDLKRLIKAQTIQLEQYLVQEDKQLVFHDLKNGNKNLSLLNGSLIVQLLR